MRVLLGIEYQHRDQFRSLSLVTPRVNEPGLGLRHRIVEQRWFVVMCTLQIARDGPGIGDDLFPVDEYWQKRLLGKRQATLVIDGNAMRWTGKPLWASAIMIRHEYGRLLKGRR